MQSAQCLPGDESLAAADKADQASGPYRILCGVFEAFDQACIPYCVLHGYEGYPQQIKGDVDCMISPTATPRQVAAILHAGQARLGAKVVRRRGFYFVLAGENADGSACFLDLDLRVHYELDHRRYYTGAEVLENRRRRYPFWVPAPRVQYGCNLVRRISKCYLDDNQGRILSDLYRQDAAGCQEEVARFWGTVSSALIASAAASGDWKPVRRALAPLRAELHRRIILRQPVRGAGSRLRLAAGRIRRVLRPDNGLNVIFLGVDGAGKSSVIQGVRQELAGAFSRTVCYGFPPALLRRLLGRPEGPTALPHALPCRSFLGSALRALCYWSVYSTLGYYLTVYPALARSALVLHDRHLVDALVDPNRYRYAGPSWLLRLIWRFIPKPDLVVLLDAAPAVLHARKQELPFGEIVRQREAYLSLVSTMKNGYVADAARTLPQVVHEVRDLVLRHLAKRAAHRLGLEQII